MDFFGFFNGLDFFWEGLLGKFWLGFCVEFLEAIVGGYSLSYVLYA